MQGELNSADRKLLWGGGVVMILLMAGTIAFAPAAREPLSATPSTYSSSSGGARAAYLLLLDLRYPAQRWEEPPSGLAKLGDGVTLIFAEPTEKPSRREREWLLHFVERGGRILFCGDSITSFFPKAKVSPPDDDLSGEEFSRIPPGAASPSERRIVMRPKAFWRGADGSQIPLYGSADGAVVVAWRVGAGEILWWASAMPLTNSGITRGDNLALFLDAINGPSAVYWDEYFHGQRGSLWAYVERTPVKWGLLQITFLVLGVLFTFSRRWGPIAAPATASRLSPLEFVDALGGLYQRAGASSIAIGVPYRHLRLKLTQRLALATGVRDRALAEAARERLGWDGSEFANLMERAERASTGKPRPREALDLVQKLERYTARLAPHAPAREKT